MGDEGDNIVDDFRAFVEEFKDESDRAIVVITAARLDYLLYCILQKYLVPNTSTTDDFFENQGPGATFSNKIMLAYRLGLIDKDMARSLNLVRRVRNDFAHEASGCSLDKGSYKDRVKALIAPYKKLPLYRDFQKALIKASTQYRAHYMTVLGFLITRLSYLFEEITLVNDKDAWPVVNKDMRDYKPEQLASADSGSGAALPGTTEQ